MWACGVAWPRVHQCTAHNPVSQAEAPFSRSAHQQCSCRGDDGSHGRRSHARPHAGGALHARPAAVAAAGTWAPAALLLLRPRLARLLRRGAVDRAAGPHLGGLHRVGEGDQQAVADAGVRAAVHGAPRAAGSGAQVAARRAVRRGEGRGRQQAPARSAQRRSRRQQVLRAQGTVHECSTPRERGRAHASAPAEVRNCTKP